MYAVNSRYKTPPPPRCIDTTSEVWRPDIKYYFNTSDMTSITTSQNLYQSQKQFPPSWRYLPYRTGMEPESSCMVTMGLMDKNRDKMINYKWILNYINITKTVPDNQLNPSWQLIYLLQQPPISYLALDLQEWILLYWIGQIHLIGH